MHMQSPATSVPSVPFGGGPVGGQWSVVGAIAFVTAVMGAGLLSAYMIQSGYEMWLARSDPVSLSGWPPASDARFLIGVQLTAQLLQLLLIWTLVGIWHTDRSAAFNLAPPGLTVGQWLGAVVLLFAVKTAVTVIALGIAPSNFNRELGPIVRLVREPTVWLLFLAAVVLAGLTEELLFRGVLSRTLEATRLGFWGGAAIASAAFALLHVQYGTGGRIVIFAIGMTLAWIRSRSQSLWPAIVCHSINNAAAVFAMRAVA